MSNNYPSPILEITVFDEFDGEVYYDYSDLITSHDDRAESVEKFLEVMFAAYKQLGFCNELEVKICGTLLGDDLNVIKFDPTKGDKPVYMENVEE